jgi:AraC-like DNA-binding protein
MAVLALESLGINPDPILKECKISKLSLLNPVGRIPVEKETRFWKLAVEVADDPQLPIRMSASVPFGTFSLLDYIGASCQSVYEAMEMFTRYASVVYGNWHSALSETQEGVCFDLGVDGDADESKHSTEFGLSVLLDRLKRFANDSTLIPIKAIHFRHQFEGQLSAYTEVLGVEPSFGQTSDRIFFDVVVKTLPCRNSNSLVLGSLLKLADGMFSKLPGNSAQSSSELSTQIKKYIIEQITLGNPEIGNIAKSVAMSSRTLQRKLNEQGQSLRGIVNETKQELAAELLANPKLSLEEIGMMLGYSNYSAFNRAFKAWHKVTPATFRKRI